MCLIWRDYVNPSSVHLALIFLIKLMVYGSFYLKFDILKANLIFPSKKNQMFKSFGTQVLEIKGWEYTIISFKCKGH